MVGCARVTVLPEFRRVETGLLFTLIAIIGASGVFSSWCTHPASQGLMVCCDVDGSGSVGMDLRENQDLTFEGLLVSGSGRRERVVGPLLLPREE